MKIQILAVNVNIISVCILIFGNLIFGILINIIRTTTAAFRDIFIISLAVRPKRKVLAKYLFLILVLPDFRPARIFISSAKERSKEDFFGKISFPKAGDLKILKSERVRRLQGKIIKTFYYHWFSISCSSEELYILSTFANTGWLIHNLLRAAGIRKRRGIVLNRENRKRIQTVFAAYINSLAIYLKFENGRRPGGRGDVITRALYPLEIELAGLKIKKANILSFAHEGKQQIEVNREYINFTNYLNIQPLVMEGRMQDRDKIENLMKKLESLH